jgi:hypothetical protein
LPSRISAPLLVAIALSEVGIGGMDPAQGQPSRGDVGGPASGAGVLPGAGFGRPGQSSVALLLWLPRPEAWADRLPAPECNQVPA